MSDPGISAVGVIQYLLENDADLLELVTAANIMAGPLPPNTVLPAICLHEISTTERLAVAMTDSHTLASSRIQVTIIAATLPQQKTILGRVCHACRNRRGTIDMTEVDSILPDIDGPDMQDSTVPIFAQTKDFMVKFSLAN